MFALNYNLICTHVACLHSQHQPAETTSNPISCLQFVEAKVYHNKLVNIRKEMIMLHEKTTKLKVSLISVVFNMQSLEISIVNALSKTEANIGGLMQIK